MRTSVFFYILIWVIFQIITLLFQLKGVSQVSALAHIGGALTGVGFWVWNEWYPAD